MTACTNISRRTLLSALALVLALTGVGLVVVPHVLGEWHYRCAQKELARYRLPEARAHIDRCLRVWPRSGQIHLLAARAARQGQDYAAADTHLTECQRLAGGATEDVILERMLLRAQLGEVDAVVAHLRPLVESNHPASGLILEAMAWGCMQQFRVSEAVFYLGLLRAREPDNIRALLYEGWAREMLNVADEAIDDYRRALELQPDNVEARLRLANCLLEGNRGSEALEHFLYLHTRHPESELFGTGLGRSYLSAGQIQEARQILDRVLAAHPNYAPALTARARLALQTGEHAAAEAWLRATLRLDPTSYTSYYLLYQSLEQQGKEKEARAARERMEQIKADLARIRAIINEHLAESPRDPGLYHEAGVLLVRTGDNQEALKWFASALRHDPRHLKTHSALAQLYEHIGEVGKAAYHRKFVPENVTMPRLQFPEQPTVGAPGGY